MIESGMVALMKGFGLDPAEIKQHVEAFTSHMKAQAAAINANQQRIEAKLEAHDAKLDELLNRTAAQPVEASTTEILDVSGRPTNVLVTSERFPQAMIDDVNGVGRRLTFDDHKRAGLVLDIAAASAAEERSAGEA